MPDPIGEWYDYKAKDAKMWRKIRDAYDERLADELLHPTRRKDLVAMLKAAERALEAAQYVGD